MEMTTPTRQSTIEARRFVLRPLDKSDLGALETHTGDERVARMTREIPHPLPPGVTQAFIERALSPDRVEDVWVLDGTKSGMGEVLGGITLECMDREQCEISIWVVPGLWGSGIATEAVTAILEANPLACRTFFAAVFQDNPASARVLTDLGFAYIGDAEYYSVARGAQVPTWTYVHKIE